MKNDTRPETVKHEVHPDREEINKMLKEGESPYKIVAWLRRKYPTKPELWLGRDTLYVAKQILLEKERK